MRAPPVFCIGVGFAIGVACHRWQPGLQSPLVIAAGLASSLLCPVPGRMRVAGIAVFLGVVWSCLRPAPHTVPPLDGSIEGRVVGPVRRGTKAVDVQLELGSSRRIPVTLLPRWKVSEAQSLVSPCDRVSFPSSAAHLTSRGYRVRERARGGFVVTPATCLSVWRSADDLHLWLRSIIGTGRGRGLVRAMVLGDRSGLQPSDRASFRRAGVAHVLAVSGLHLAVVVAAVFALVRRFAALLGPGGRPTTLASVCGIAAAVAFTLMTGARVATVRALLMVLVVITGVALHRPICSLSALGVAILAATLVEPSLVADAGFQLSISATTILILSGGHRRARSRPARLAAIAIAAARASLATALVTAPIASAHFGRVAPAGLVANLLVVPLVEFGVLPLAITGILTSLLHGGAGAAVIDCAASVAQVSAEVASWFALAIEPRLGPSGIAEGLVCWLAALAVARAPRRSALVFLLVAALTAASAALWPGPVQRAGRLRVSFVDVGQGDAAIIEWPNNEVWLVDVGPTDRRPGRVVAELEALSIGKVDHVVLTHDHPDHTGALAELLEHYPNAQVVRARGQREGRGGIAPKLGRRQLGAAQLWFLAPIYDGDDAADDPVLGVNDNSIILLIEFAGRRLLLAGDAEDEAEERLLAAYPMLGQVDVIKVPHHGSDTSSSSELLERIRPNVAVISCGEGNRFGHPAPAVEARYLRHGAHVLRTDVHGTVTVVVDQWGTMEVRTTRELR